MSIEKDIQELTAAVKALTAVMKQLAPVIAEPTVTITEPVAAQAPVGPFYWHNPTVATFGVEDEPGAFRTSLECDPEVKEITEQEYLRLKESAAPVVQTPEAVTYEALRDVFQQLVEKKTATPLKAILEKLGVKRAPELKPEQFAGLTGLVCSELGGEHDNGELRSALRLRAVLMMLLSAVGCIAFGWAL